MIGRSSKLLTTCSASITAFERTSSFAIASLAVPGGPSIAARCARISLSLASRPWLRRRRAVTPRSQPVQLELELGVELLGGARFLGIDLLGPRLEPAKADLGAAQLPAIEPQAALGQPRQEGPVVADGDERAA